MQHSRRRIRPRVARFAPGAPTAAQDAPSGKRLSLTAHGKVCYQLKTPYRDGTTHVLFEPGFHRQTGGLGTLAQSKPDTIPRRIRRQQPTSGTDHTGKTRQRRSGGYQTYPIYEQDKVQGWRATQELLLEGPDFTQMGELIGKLQERLQVNAITFSVSPERRATVEDELIASALEAFKQRADLVRKQLGAKEYRIVNVSINHDGTAPIPMMRSSVVMETASVAAPAVQAGTSTLSVSVSAVIELQ